MAHLPASDQCSFGVFGVTDQAKHETNIKLSAFLVVRTSSVDLDGTYFLFFSIITFWGFTRDRYRNMSCEKYVYISDDNDPNK